MNKAKNFRVAFITTLISFAVSGLSILGMYFSATQFPTAPAFWAIVLVVSFLFYSLSCYVTIEGFAWAVEERKPVKIPENVIAFKTRETHYSPVTHRRA